MTTKARGGAITVDKDLAGQEDDLALVLLTGVVEEGQRRVQLNSPGGCE